MRGIRRETKRRVEGEEREDVVHGDLRGREKNDQLWNQKEKKEKEKEGNRG